MFRLSDEQNEIVLFLLFIVVFLVIFFWAWPLGFRRVPTLQGFTMREKVAIQNQMKALLFLPVLIAMIISFRFLPQEGRGVHVGAFYFGLIVGMGTLGYIAISSIREQVSIFGKHDNLPLKGRQAVWAGIANIVFIIFVVGFALFFVPFK